MRYPDNLETSEEIIRRLFDPRHNSKYIPKEAKYRYLQHFLEEKWPEICGPNLAKSCSPQKIEGNELYVRTDNSLLANELYMMQNLFLQKVNSFLLGRILIKKVYFRTSGVIRREEAAKIKEQEAAELKKLTFTVCPECGRQMESGLKMCSVCNREHREQERQRIAELLRIEPWLSYEDCLAYYPCDKILFTAVKDNLQNYYFERVRKGFANESDSLLAVLFLTGRQPQDIDDKLYNNALEYLRRDQSVSAFGGRLYGKK